MKQYLDILNNVLENGTDRPDRTGTGTRSLFGIQFRHDLQKGFPCLTTKKILWKSAIGEMLWWIEGSGDERRLAEIIHQKPREELTDKKTVWTANANSNYWKPHAKYEGDLGRPYGVQVRHWTNSNGIEFDQLLILIEGLKNDPYCRRHIITSWNPGELDNMALPPCHYNVQFYVAENKLSCLLTMRSLDLFLGFGYDVIMYAVLTHMIAKVCGFSVGELIINSADTHIYHNHFEAVEEQLHREPKDLPYLWINPSVTNIEDFKISDFNLEGYEPYPAIKAPMAV